MKNNHDLKVESYDENEVEAKKQSIAKRVSAAGSAAVLTLGLFNFASCEPLVNGGAGAWYHSCTEGDCECTECECKRDECKKDESPEEE